MALLEPGLFLPTEKLLLKREIDGGQRIVSEPVYCS
jgi:hypothetical protein